MAVVTVAIAGHIFTPAGAAPTSGRVTAKLSHAGATLNGAELVRVAAEVTADIGTGGTLAISLVPNDAITPTGTHYVVTCIVTLSNGRRVQWAEKWQLTSADLTIDLGTVPRIDTATGLSVTVAETDDLVALRSADAAETAARAAADALIIASGNAPADVGIAPVIATGSTTARTVADRAADEVWLEDFGGVGDGSTDNTAAMNAALAFLHAAGGGTLLGGLAQLVVTFGLVL